MMKEKVQPIDKKLRKAAIKAFRGVEKMIREEPHPIVISDGSSSDSSGTLKEVTGWLFQGRHKDGCERNRTCN
jgi:hypothetical protein